MAELKIKADSGGGTVSFKGPATTTSNAAVQLTLPVDDGTANQYLKTDGSGALSWATVDTSLADDAVTAAKIADNAVVTAGINAGAVTGPKLADGMVVTNKSWHAKSWSTHTGSTDWNGPVIGETQSTITPTSATNKILVMVCMFIRVDNNNASVTQTGIQYKVDRVVSGQSDVEVWIGDNYIVQPESSGNDWIDGRTVSFFFVDDPSTASAVFYKVSTKLYESSATCDIGTAAKHKGITLLELKNS